ncbi:hypothetical protein AMELA_G00235100 [Ameiurus melas]|uniref:Pyrin domain-containing protein n=1 Tax=Ameiurus melas TaxID=219545 RepID=A0A7J6A0P8_AMEME|nr:hypothetical protein AMELA_G00235100 [Ameiurus melas]
MSSISWMLVKQLDELVQHDFERFKWSLTRNNAQDFRPVPRSKLENAKQHKVVDLLVDQYGEENAANITIKILKDIGQENLASDLEKMVAGQVQAKVVEVDGASSHQVDSSSSSSSSRAVGVSQEIKADTASTVSAPVQSGGIYNGPVTMNFTK